MAQIKHSEHSHTRTSETEDILRVFTLSYSRRHGISIVVLLAVLILVYHRYASECSMRVAEESSQYGGKYPSAEEPPPATSIFLPYTKPFTMADVPLVKTTIEGVDLDMPVDTGSTGILVGASLLPSLGPEDGVPTYHYFTSSKILYNGRLINLTVTFHGGGNSYAKATVPVFVVDESWKCPWYDPNKDTFTCPLGPKGEKPIRRDKLDITYMGVGFGRNRPGSGQPGAVPSANPFLNIVSLNGRDLPSGLGRAGWVISTEGVHVGLTDANTRGFNFTRLEQGAGFVMDPRDWAMVRMQFSVDGMETGSGHGLVDSGVAQMYINAEDDFDIPVVRIPNPNPRGIAKNVWRVKSGTQLSIGFPSLGEKQVAGYGLIVGEHSPMAPSFVAPGKKTPPPYLNTGRGFLYRYAIAFDAVGGRFGFGPARLSPAAQL